nr:cellulase family glycosylhydrolase [uncultured Carboxylicivirga sp.]
MISKQKIVSLLLLLLCSIPMLSQGFLRAEGKEIVNDKGAFLLKSIGTGNWMIQEGYMMQSTGANINTHTQFRNKLASVIGEEKTADFYKNWLANQFSKSDLDSMKQWGFNAVRPALHYKWFTLPIQQEKRNSQEQLSNTWLPKGFAMLDSLVSWCKANQMYVIFDMHGTPGGQGKDANISDYDPQYPSLWESKDNQKKLITLWKEIATRYKDEPWVGGYELINEPNWNVDQTGNQNGCECTDNEALWDLHQELIEAVREVDQKHLIFISGNCWGNNYNGFENHSLKDIDDNVALTFHKYWNTNHQNSITAWLEMRDKYNMPIWMSESGENSNQWFAEAIELFESNNIGWSWWPVKKSRLNNVLRVATPQNYLQLIHSWEEGQTPLDADQTYKAVMDYAEAQKTENCIVGKDVIYALLHENSYQATEPFKTHQLNTWIQCVDYDLGNEEAAYHDSVSQDIHNGDVKWSVWNSGNQYRNDGVDIGLNNGEYYVGWTEDNEWLQFTILIPQEGEYNIQLKAAGEAGVVSVLADSKIVAENVWINETKDPFGWKTTKIKKVQLPKGEVKLRLYINEGGCNLQSFSISQCK